MGCRAVCQAEMCSATVKVDDLILLGTSLGVLK